MAATFRARETGTLRFSEESVDLVCNLRYEGDNAQSMLMDGFLSIAKGAVRKRGLRER